MLYITRKAGEAIVMNTDVTIESIDMKSKIATLGVPFPPQTPVLRQAVLEHLTQEDLRAAESTSLIQEE
jgi:carbon storage regulator CsrA